MIPGYAGWLVVGVGAVDLLVAAFLWKVRPPADPRARRNLPLILGMAGAGMVAIGAAILLGLVGGA